MLAAPASEPARAVGRAALEVRRDRVGAPQAGRRGRGREVKDGERADVGRGLGELPAQREVRVEHDGVDQVHAVQVEEVPRADRAAQPVEPSVTLVILAPA